jgi:hypothetical protein
MLQKALEPSMQCYAFSKSDKRRCRLERDHNKNTCHIHRNYYTNWLEKCRPTVKWEAHSSREKAEIIFQLSSRAVELPSEFITMLPRFHTGFFLTFMKYTDHSPLMNYYCLIDLIDQLVATEKYNQEIDCILKDSNCVHVILYILQKRLLYLSNESIEEYFRTLTKFTRQENYRHILYSSYTMNVFKQNIDYFKQVTPFFPELFTPGLWDSEEGLVRKWVREFNEYHSKRVAERSAIFKEELLAKAWHPDRVERWIESGIKLENL